MNTDTRLILDKIDQYVFLKDRNGIYRYANQPFAMIAGVDSPEGIVGKTDRELSWTDAECWWVTDAHVLAGKSIVRMEEAYRCSARDFKFLITKTPYRNEKGEIIGILGNFLDCSGRLILETKGKFDENKLRLHLEYVPEWLSAAEVRVCFYLIHGFSTRRIAEKTGTTESTIRFHIDNIKNKMQCTTKSEIVETAMRTGIAWKIMSLQHADDFDLKIGQ